MRTSGRVSEKMCRVLHKLQRGIRAGANSHYHNLHSDAKVRGGDLVPDDVPAGCLVVYVGDERRRFVIKAKTLNHTVFRALLEQSAEEFGYKHEGGLILDCDVAFFEHLLRLINAKDPSLCRTELQHYWNFSSDSSRHVLSKDQFPCSLPTRQLVVVSRQFGFPCRCWWAVTGQWPLISRLVYTYCSSGCIW